MCRTATVVFKIQLVWWYFLGFKIFFQKPFFQGQFKVWIEPKKQHYFSFITYSSSISYYHFVIYLLYCIQYSIWDFCTITITKSKYWANHISAAFQYFLIALTLHKIQLKWHFWAVKCTFRRLLQSKSFQVNFQTPEFCISLTNFALCRCCPPNRFNDAVLLWN